MADGSLFEKLGLWLHRLLVVYLVALGIEMAACLLVIAMLASAGDTELDQDQLRTVGFTLMTMGYAGYLQFGAFVAIAVLFMRFMYKAVQRAKGFAVPFTYVSPGWAVGYWFIPLMNLYRPFEVVKALVKACAEEAGTPDKPAAGEQLLGAWWALFLLGNIVASAVARMDLDLSTAAGLMSYLDYTLGSDVLLILSTPLFWVVITRLVRAMGSSSKTIPGG